MIYREFKPQEQLRDFVKCIYFFESSGLDATEDTVFPGGTPEIIFNLGNGLWKTKERSAFVQTPSIELWGQLTKPLPVQSEGKNTMLGIRFHPYGLASFFNVAAFEFSDRVVEAGAVLGRTIEKIREQLLNTSSLIQRIELINRFLLERFVKRIQGSNHVNLISQVARELQQEKRTEKIKSIASQYGVTPRYLQKLFLDHVGVTPKVLQKINRFQSTLACLSQEESSLTDIAYSCGYFDQSHFIREFKSFTGVSPSKYLPSSSVVLSAMNDFREVDIQKR